MHRTSQLISYSAKIINCASEYYKRATISTSFHFMYPMSALDEYVRQCYVIGEGGKNNEEGRQLNRLSIEFVVTRVAFLQKFDFNSKVL